MTEKERADLVSQVKETLITAGSAFPEGKIECYQSRIREEDQELSRWVMETVVENAVIAQKERSPLCDDTGIPHLLIDIGKNRVLSGEMLDAISQGVEEGLRDLPGRPMAVRGNDAERIDQSGGLDANPEAVVPAPLMIRKSEEADRMRLTVLMLGGGPEIRAKTYRIFHHHSLDRVTDEIIQWAAEAVAQLGCTPCTLAVGIGRSHYEASSLMLQAMADGDYRKQSEIEKTITDGVNRAGTGVMSFGGLNSVLAAFVKIGPQRASGVRIVCMRPCCCFEPRRASADLIQTADSCL